MEKYSQRIFSDTDCELHDSSNSSLNQSLESVSLNDLDDGAQKRVPDIPGHFDSKRSWLILICGYLMQIIVMGLLHTYGIFYVAFLQEFKSGEALTAFVGSSCYGLNMLTGSVVGILQARLQTRFIMIIGCILCSVSCFLTSYADRIEILFATFSFVFGVGSSFCYTPTICLPQVYFLKYLSLATGVMMAGSSTGTLVMSPIVQRLVVTVGWRYTLRIFSILCLCCIPLLVVISPPNVGISLRHSESRRVLSELRIWKNRVFIIWASAVTLAMFSYNTPGVHLIALGEDKGIPAEQGTYFLIVFGVCASVGRVLWGKLLEAEILNWTNAHQCALIMTGTAHTFLPIFTTFSGIMAYVVIVGLLDGGYVVLLPLLTSQFLGAERTPVVWGFVISAASVSFMLGPAVSGILRATTGAYDLAFHVIGLTMIAAGLLEFLIPWAKRTANPERTLVSMLSEIHPGSTADDIDEDLRLENVSRDEEDFGVHARYRCRSVTSSGRRSKVSFGGISSPRQQSKASQQTETVTAERVGRRRCQSESVNKDEPEPEPVRSSQVVRVGPPTSNDTSVSFEPVVSYEPDPEAERQREPIPTSSLDTVHENEILKITTSGRSTED